MKRFLFVFIIFLSSVICYCQEVIERPPVFYLPMGDNYRNIWNDNTITSFTNGTTTPLSLLVTSGNTISSGIMTPAGIGGCYSNPMVVIIGEQYKVEFDYVQNSGDELRVYVASNTSGNGGSRSNIVTKNTTGRFSQIFTIISNDVAAFIQLGTGNAGHTINFSATNITCQLLNVSQDISGGANHSTNYGVTDTTNRYGQRHEAYYFDGTNDSIKPANLISFADNEAFTIGFWHKTPASFSANYGFTGYNNTAGKQGKFYFDYSPQALVWYNNNGNSESIPLTLVVSTWYYITMTCNVTGTICWYLNGEKIGIDGQANTAWTIQVIGNIGKGSSDLQGNLSDPLIYDYARTPGQIKDDYKLTRHFEILSTADTNYQDYLSENLKVYYPFCAKYGIENDTVAQDISGNANHADIYGCTDTTNRFGELESAYYFDDVNDIIVPRNLITFTDGNPYSISFLWYCQSPGSYNTFFGYDAVAGKRTYLWSTGSNIQFRTDNNSQAEWGFTPTNNRWYHFVFTVGADKYIRMYRDGVKRGSAILLADSKITIKQLGEDGSGAAYAFLHGRLDEFKVFEKKLTPSQVQTLYKIR